MTAPNGRPDIVCLSHLRWGSMHQRPQHLMTRFGRSRRVFFCEEPVFGEESNPRLEVHPLSRASSWSSPGCHPGSSPRRSTSCRGCC